MKRYVWIIALLAAVLSACAGPSTRVLLREERLFEYEETISEKELEKPDEILINDTIRFLSAIFDQNEGTKDQEAAAFLRKTLSSYGYRMKYQHFSYGMDLKNSGTNVIGIREAEDAEADILLLVTHHDAADGSPCASDNASGIAAWLETARLLAQLSTDTELRFVSFSASRADHEGSLHYVETLSKEEKERIVGVLEFGNMGAKTQKNMILGTLDGKATMLGDMLGAQAEETLEEVWDCQIQSGGEKSTFVRGAIPAVSLSQNWQIPEASTAEDVPELVSSKRIAQIVEVVTQMVGQIMGEDTPSLRAKAHFYNDMRDYTYTQPIQAPCLFGETLETVRQVYGMDGTFLLNNRDQAGSLIEKYKFCVKWFGRTDVLDTYAYFLDGKLEELSLDGMQAGLTFLEMQEILTQCYGRPTAEEEGPYGIAYHWTDPVYRLFLALIPNADGYEVQLSEYSPVRTILYQKDTENGALPVSLEDARMDELLDLIYQIWTLDDLQSIARLTFYTDGVGATDGYIKPVDAKRSEIELCLDLDDAYDGRGEWRNYTETYRLIRTLRDEVREQSETESETEMGNEEEL